MCLDGRRAVDSVQERDRDRIRIKRGRNLVFNVSVTPELQTNGNVEEETERRVCWGGIVGGRTKESYRFF